MKDATERRLDLRSPCAVAYRARSVGLLLGEDECDARAAAAGAAGATDAVDTARVVCGRVEVDDRRDLDQVEVASCKLGRDQNPYTTGSESLQRPFPPDLWHIAANNCIRDRRARKLEKKQTAAVRRHREPSRRGRAKRRARRVTALRSRESSSSRIATRTRRTLPGDPFDSRSSGGGRPPELSQQSRNRLLLVVSRSL
jgi:hypothetical protein